MIVAEIIGPLPGVNPLPDKVRYIYNISTLDYSLNCRIQTDLNAMQEIGK